MDTEIPVADYKRALEELYRGYNRREAIHPDPLEVLYDYEEILDREIVALVASSLAYGKVQQILRSVILVLERMPMPSAFLQSASPQFLRNMFAGFRHRVYTGEELSALLLGVKRALERHGSLQGCFTAGLHDDQETVLPALSRFVAELTAEFGSLPTRLLPSPAGGSACKRLNLFLRWMVRRDEVDPGGWDNVPRSKLVVPLDTHMHRICRALKLTARRQANLRTAVEITDAFKRIAPEDPVRYDFALTRLGMAGETALIPFLTQCAAWRSPRTLDGT